MKTHKSLIIVLALLACLFCLSSCESIKLAVIESKTGIKPSELKELQKTMDPSVNLTPEAAILAHFLTKEGSDGFNTNAGISDERLVETIELSNCLLRIAYPKQYIEGSQLPAVYFAHGGAFTMGNYPAYQDFVGKFCDNLNAVVFFPEYRLAPEHPFPAAVEDVWEGYLWMLENGNKYDADLSRIALCGDSAGANFAAGIDLRLWENGMEQPSCVVLMYPNVSVSSTMLPSHMLFGGFDGKPAIVNTRLMADTLSKYLNSPEDAFKPYASPMIMMQGAIEADGYSNPYSKYAIKGERPIELADHLLQIAQADSLRDEGLAYHAALTILGTDSTLHVYEGMVHGFVMMDMLLPEAKTAQKEAFSFISNHWQ